MPRGVPNAKRDDTGLRYTTFNVPLAPNPKHMSTTYLKTESQTLWARNAVRKARQTAEAGPQENRRGSNVLVIHPGSRYLRVGRASDVNPVTVPNVIARRLKTAVPEPMFLECISRPQPGAIRPRPPSTQGADEYSVTLHSDDPFDAKIASIQISLRDRMRFYKLRVTSNAAQIASTFNEQFKPEIILDHNDPYRVEWITNPTEELYVGDTALRIAEPYGLNYSLRWPIYGANFNTRDGSSLQVILSDIESIISSTIKEHFNIEQKSFKDYSVVLVIPDFHERAYVRDLTNLLLVSMGFKQICVQQESLAATYGAGISSACVVDIGATTTSIACVDEGLVVGDSRMCLSMGGDDITEFFYVLLGQISFPYRDANLARWHDWNVMEDLKSRLCTLAESDVALNLYDFVVRRPDRPAEKYGLRAYDEIILAPMCIFEPRVIEFEKKPIAGRLHSQPDITEEIMEHPTDKLSQAMIISTQHLIPQILPTPTPLPGLNGQTGPSTPQASSSIDTSSKEGGSSTPAEASPSKPTSPPATQKPTEGSAEAPMEIVDVDTEATTPTATASATGVQSVPPAAMSSKVHSSGSAFAGGGPGPGIDIYFEASKLPLDVAIFNSTRAAGGDEKIRKYLQAVLVIGGTALMPGMAHALESRLQAIATPLVHNMEKVQIIPPPKDVDQRVLAWKGAAVLGKMDGVSDLWLTAADWDVLGMRGLKERCFYL